MRTAFALSLIIVFAGCKNEAGPPPAPKAVQAVEVGKTAQPAMPAGPAGQVAATHGSEGGAAAGGLSGKVVEIKEVASYTYLKLAIPGGGEVWSAVPKATVEEGAMVTIVKPMLMKDFESPTLGERFDKIYFGNLAGPGTPAGGMAGGGMAGGGMPAGHPQVGGDAAPAPGASDEAGQAHAGAAAPERTVQAAVAKADGDSARTISEVHAQTDALAGKKVRVSGKVVKFSSGILGRNWVHIQDGTGSPETKDFDLTVTTQDTVAVGDVVVAEGVVAKDKDFGMGYSYDVMVEEAKLARTDK